MRWMFAFFVIFPVIAIVANTFEHGHGGVILMPIYAAIALGAFFTMRRSTKALKDPGQTVLLIVSAMALVYFGHEVYVGTLSPWELAPPGRNQIAAGTAASSNAAFLGWGGLALFIGATFLMAVRSTKTAEGQFLAAAARHVGRGPDTSLFSRDNKGYWHLMMWGAERKFYLSKAFDAFDAQRMRSFGEVREWAIEKSQKVVKEQILDVYTVNIALMDANNPLIQFYCGQNKQAAFHVTEMLNQMAERNRTISEASVA